MKRDDIKYGKINLDLGLDFAEDQFLTVRRYRRSPENQVSVGCIMGLLLLDDEPLCYTQERSQYALRIPDPVKEPLGYKIELSYSNQIAGKRHNWWEYLYNNYPIKKELIANTVPEIMAPNRAGIRFHPGDNYLWSEGCVICGAYSSKSNFVKFDAPDKVWASAQVWTALYPILARKKGKVYINIEKSDLIWDPGTPPPELFTNLIESEI